ncbi:7-alpha-hydroxysteroid dehydrogenase [Nitrosomonas eutropha]|uniref:7-alpha-hydroxysteroid dehydrogenase n=1 Tax=Nitrosomonas eutropha TaxID=916 RepID=A0A1I7FFI7_9PROT|nr:glucose 1-dehydrogenase [Nitrosomonas eutropha]SFU34962.1 7-alpha-hydroxysteroid dehydrogenase [Nitrosomonas eutropha]
MNQSLWDLTGKTAIVTGGAAGIGRACVQALARAGASVMIADLNEKVARETAQETAVATGGDVRGVACNILEDTQLVAAVDATLEAFNRINILVNNAGGGGAGRESPQDITVEVFARDFQLNVFAAWRLAQLVAPHMTKDGYGSIINITSMSSINKSPAMSGYAASKAALNHMGANLAFDYGPIVRINAVGPGATRTAALKTVLTPEIEKRMLAHTPIKRLGEPEDIAGAVLYFAAPISSWVSGQTLFVNGGGVQTLD